MNTKKRITRRLERPRELLCDEDAMLAFVAKHSYKLFRKHNRTLFQTNGHRRFRRVMRSIREGHGPYYSKLLERRILLSQGGDTWLAAKDNKCKKSCNCLQTTQTIVTSTALPISCAEQPVKRNKT